MTGLQWPPGAARPAEGQNGHRPAHALTQPYGSPGARPAVPLAAPVAPRTESSQPAARPPASGQGFVPPGRAGRLSAPAPSAGVDARLMAGVPEILAMVADLLPDRAERPEVMSLIRDAVRAWTQRQIRLGVPVPGTAELEALAQAVYDQRYGLGPLAGYLRDPQVENVDINGCDRVWVTYATGERVAGPPVAASDEAWSR